MQARGLFLWLLAGLASPPHQRLPLEVRHLLMPTLQLLLCLGCWRLYREDAQPLFKCPPLSWGSSPTLPPILTLLLSADKQRLSGIDQDSGCMNLVETEILDVENSNGNLVRRQTLARYVASIWTGWTPCGNDLA